MITRKGRYTLLTNDKVNILGFAAIGSKKEYEGPLGKQFDKIFHDPKAGMPTWEQAESMFVKEAVSKAITKAELTAEDIDYIFAGDLLNQCISSSYGLKDFSIPYLGQYGACSTMAQSLIMSTITLESGAASFCAAASSSHFCSAERQYRFPLEYGGQRTPTAQWTVTGAGCCILGKERNTHPSVSAVTVGRITDRGVTDANNMGAAMAPAAAATIMDFFSDTGRNPSEFDGIFTGDLGAVGSKLLYELTESQGLHIKNKHRDCGLMIYNPQSQDVHAGGSGCGCAASVLCCHILPKLIRGDYSNILFVATGALMSPTACQQGQTIPSIAHLVEISSPAKTKNKTAL